MKQLFLAFTLVFFSGVEALAGSNAAQEAHEFLAMYNPVFQQLTAAAERASWLAKADVSDEHTGQQIGAEQAKAAFTGNTYVIAKASELLKHRGDLDRLHIAKNVLNRPPKAADYYGNRAVGTFLNEILKLGATRDWKAVLHESIGQEISSRAMLEYFAPLTNYLQEQNKGQSVGW